MNNIVRWNLQDLMSAIQSLEDQRGRIENEIVRMREQHVRVSNNWRSSAGNIYRGRLNDDLQTLNNILRDLQARITQLRRVHGIYENAENRIRSALSRLPR